VADLDTKTTWRGVTMLERMKAAFSRLGVLAANYLPAGFKDVQLDMAAKIDEFERRIYQLEKEK
jgi:hypothetical protein